MHETRQEKLREFVERTGRDVPENQKGESQVFLDGFAYHVSAGPLAWATPIPRGRYATGFAHRDGQKGTME